MIRATHIRLLGLTVMLLLAIGCRRTDGASTPAAGLPTRPAVLMPLPTLYPTATPETLPSPAATRPAAAAEPTPTPVDFGQAVVILRYAIPALGLDRVLEGNVASQITLRDEITGVEVRKSNQAAVLLELQSVLGDLDLAAVPDNCGGCVRFEYQLPLAQEAGAGWLQDPRLLASVENFFAANLGPHYPPGTTVGLRRSAANTDAAHTVAVAEDGTLWRWTAVETIVVGGQPDAPAGGQILAAAAALDTADMAGARYWLDCPGKPLEWLRLSDAAGAALESRIRCPELTLPTTLTPLYLALASAAAPLLSGDLLPAGIAPPLPIDQHLYYAAPAGSLLLAEPDAVTLSGGAAVTGTVPISASIGVSLTLAISNTSGLRAADLALAQRGLVTDTATLAPYVLILRTPDGVLAATWTTAPPAGARLLVGQLDQLLASLLDQLGALPLPGTPTPTPETTPAPTLPPSATPAPTATATSPPTAVP